jgi:dTDP-4-dehydrorhamnose reductase
MKILLTGASGMLSSDVVPELKKLGHEVIETDKKPRLENILEMDVTDIEKIKEFAKKYQPDFIFHLAAETDVDLCERENEHAFLQNTTGTENVALVCKELNIPLVYTSTAGVFFGDKETPYDETDEPRPANVYGESKLQGEHKVKELLTDVFIVRPGWMVGGWDIDKKFVRKIVDQIRSGKKELRVVSDKIGSPTFTMDFAKNIMPLVETKKFGLYHITNKGTCTRHDVATKIVEFMGLENEITIHAISSDEFPLPAPRADSEMMDNMNLEKLGINNMPHWEESLEKYIKSNI